MSASSPAPWDVLSEADASHRLATLTAVSPVSLVGSFFSRDAVFSTGVSALDRLLPDGGIAFGTAVELCGPPSSGKSFLAQRIATAFVTRAMRDWSASSDWRLYVLLAAPAAWDVWHFAQRIRHTATRDGDVPWETSEDTRWAEKVCVVPFTTPNELLLFFRTMPERGRRRVLLLIDHTARLWEGDVGFGHARHWMAAALTREMRLALAVGNGWRSNGTADTLTGGVAVLWVNGARRQKGVVIQKPLGPLLWEAAGADVRLFMEPLVDGTGMGQKRGREEEEEMEEEEEEEEEREGEEFMPSFTKFSVRVHLVKGGSGEVLL